MLYILPNGNAVLPSTVMAISLHLNDKTGMYQVQIRCLSNIMIPATHPDTRVVTANQLSGITAGINDMLAPNKPNIQPS